MVKGLTFIIALIQGPTRQVPNVLRLPVPDKYQWNACVAHLTTLC